MIHTTVSKFKKCAYSNVVWFPRTEREGWYLCTSEDLEEGNKYKSTVRAAYIAEVAKSQEKNFRLILLATAQERGYELLRKVVKGSFPIFSLRFLSNKDTPLHELFSYVNSYSLGLHQMGTNKLDQVLDFYLQNGGSKFLGQVGASTGLIPEMILFNILKDRNDMISNILELLQKHGSTFKPQVFVKQRGKI